MADLPNGTVTLLFSDVDGSTELVKRLGERYGDVLAEHRRLLRGGFTEQGGIEIDTQGDAFFIAFGSARGAVAAAVSAQQALVTYPWRDGVEVRVRMGLHTCEPHRSSESYELGLDFYDRLVDALLASGIQPCVTLYHWDLPQPLEDAGGWPSRDTAVAFVEYAEVVARRLGDRVTRWITHNEPWVTSWLGYGWGMLAPGRASDDDAVAAAHHLLLSHGWAAEMLRREVPAAEVGITLNLTHAEPANDTEADADAARQVDAQMNRWFLDPLVRGEYPTDLPYTPPVRAGDLETIAAPLDFLGVNYYFRVVAEAGASEGGLPVFTHVPGATYTDMGWEVYPEGFYECLVRVARDYEPRAIYVTENGAAFGDVRLHDGSVSDPERRDFLAGHLGAVERAIAAGTPVRGYYVWSLLDNFEWAYGYAKRFGIVFVDYPTLERVPKASFHWYRDLIAAQRREPAWRASA